MNYKAVERKEGREGRREEGGKKEGREGGREGGWDREGKKQQPQAGVVYTVECSKAWYPIASAWLGV